MVLEVLVLLTVTVVKVVLLLVVSVLLVLLQGVMLQGAARRVRTVPNSCCALVPTLGTISSKL